MIYPYYKQVDEEFRQIKDTNYYISNLGRVKNAKTGRFLRPDPSKRYAHFRLWNNILAKISIINGPRTMLEAFYPELPPNYYAHHQSLLIADDSITNVVPLTAEEHRKIHREINKAILDAQCVVYDINDNPVAEFDNVYEAGRELGINYK